MSDEDPSDFNGLEAPALSLIPTTTKKKQTKPKARIRPTLKKTSHAILKKNASSEHADETSRKVCDGSNVPDENTEEPATFQKQKTNETEIATPVDSQPRKEGTAVLSIKTNSSAVKFPSVRKPVRPKAPIIKKGLSISIGSSIPHNELQDVTLVAPLEGDQEAQMEENSLAVVPVAAAADSTMTTNNPQMDEDRIIPYQHLGLLDPTLNIPAPKPGEKTMKDFCSKYIIPKEARTVSRSTKHTNSENLPVALPPPDEAKDERSAPFVEIINGEIVIKESSMIVGGRRTTEEVDRELEGAIVEEENVGITATYNSFTKRQKTSRWTVQDTRNFYLALRQCGTDFSTMENLFNGEDGSTKRTRKELKSKYLRETKKNLKLIDMAMNPAVQLPLDLSAFGDLDMEAVKDSVIPLGLLGPLDQAGSVGASMGPVSTLNHKRKFSPSVVTQTEEDEMDVVVEDASSEAPTTEVQPAGGPKEATQEEVYEPTPEGAEIVDFSTNASPLVVPIMKKKQQRPKFRVKAKPISLKSIHSNGGKK